MGRGVDLSRPVDPRETELLALTQADRNLVQRCLKHDPVAWTEFVDRFLGVIYHVIHHAAHKRSIILNDEDVDDLAADVMAQLVDNDFRVLRNFGGRSSVATYLAVVARRVVVNQLSRRQAYQRKQVVHRKETEPYSRERPPDLLIETEEEVQRLLDGLAGVDEELVRAFYLEHKSYQDISLELGIPENSIGPMLTRIREKLRNESANS